MSGRAHTFYAVEKEEEEAKKVATRSEMPYIIRSTIYNKMLSESLFFMRLLCLDQVWNMLRYTAKDLNFSNLFFCAPSFCCCVFFCCCWHFLLIWPTPSKKSERYQNWRFSFCIFYVVSFFHAIHNEKKNFSLWTYVQRERTIWSWTRVYIKSSRWLNGKSSRTNERSADKVQGKMKRNKEYGKLLRRITNDCLEFARISRYRRRKRQFNWSVLFGMYFHILWSAIWWI